MRRLIIVLAATPVLLVRVLQAQPQATVELSLKRAVDIALTPEGSAKVALAQQSIRQAETRVQQARGAFLPSVDGSVQDRDQTTNLKAFGFNFALPLPGFALPSIVGPYSVLDARASVQQNVLDFTTLSQYKASKSGVASAKADLSVVNDQVSEQVARGYLASLRADAALETTRADVELADALLKLSQQQKDAGTGTGIEVTRAQVQLANNRQQMIVAENGQRRALQQLLRVMGVRLDEPVRLTGKLEFQPADSPAINAALTQARNMRTDLKAQKQKEETARLNFSKVRAERLPSLAAFGDYGTIGSEIVGAHPTHTVGITLKVPLYDGGRRDARRQESDSEYRQEQIRTHDLELQIELDVRLALDSLESARSQVMVAQEGVGLSENELEQARRRYQAGVTNSVEVTDAQTRLDRARDNQIAALYNYNLARIDLATATGTIGEYVNQ
ncbi:MAG TPA: TolC family protein [Bryobacteraceae bacterium]|nr:TolC family protein [Bryobacteraceae bacterium]